MNPSPVIPSIDPTKLGGSDSGALVGLDPFKSAIDIYARVVEGVRFLGNANTRRGLRFEGPIKEEYVEATGAKLLGSVPLDFGGRDYIRANLDDVAEVYGERRVLEVKTANFRQAGNWGAGSDEIPPHYLAQINWYMRAARLSRADVAVLLGGCELRVYTVDGDAELQEMLLEAADKFWKDCVLPKKPPEPDASASYAEWLAKRYPRHEKPMLQATTEIDLLASVYRAASENVDRYTNEMDEAKNRLRAIIADAEGIQGNGYKITYRANKDGSRTDWEGLARSLGADASAIAKFTTTKPGPRVFRLTTGGKQS